MENISRIHSVRTGTAEPCPLCSQGFWTGDDSGKWLDQQTNHMLEAHGCRLLHVGQETSEGADGLWQLTVAVLGVPRDEDAEPDEDDSTPQIH